MKYLSIKITGKVQGVFFRASAKEVADQLTIKGVTQNMPDGSVYMEAEGEEDNLKRFIEWCKQGPPRAQVTRVDVQKGEVKNFEKFEIRR